MLLFISGCSFEGIGTAKNGKPYYFDSRCKYYNIDADGETISCFDGGQNFTGTRKPLSQEAINNYYLREQLSLLQQQQITEAIRNSTPKTTNCTMIGSQVFCNSY